MAELSKSLVAHFAGIWLLTCVNSQMLSEITRVEESFGAARTLVIVILSSVFVFVYSAGVD